MKRNKFSYNEMDYYREILIDHLNINYPNIIMPEHEIDRRVKKALDISYRTDLHLSDIITQTFEILFEGYPNDIELYADRCLDRARRRNKEVIN